MRAQPVSGQWVYFGVFIENHKVVEVRQAVAIDDCEREQYEALPPVPPQAAGNKSSGQ